MLSSRILPAAFGSRHGARAASVDSTWRRVVGPPCHGGHGRDRVALVVTNVAKAKNRDMGRAQHFRAGKGSEKTSLGEAPRGGKGKGKTTRSQRTNKTYKRRISGRPTVDDVERASRGERTKAMGVVEREAPYRLNRDEREAWERTKRRAGHGHGKGIGGAGVLEVRSKQTDPLAPHRFPLVNTHRLYCDARSAPVVVVEQDNVNGADEILVDLSPLRVETDAPCRARLAELAEALEVGVEIEDMCTTEEPLACQVRYIITTETGLGQPLPPKLAAAAAEAGADVDLPEAPPTVEELEAAREAVATAADEVRALKDAGGTNADDDVQAGVAVLLRLKSTLETMEEEAAAAVGDGLGEAGAEAADEEIERIEEEARRSLAELPIHGLPERYVRFKCPDRATAKALAKAIAEENLLALVA